MEHLSHSEQETEQLGEQVARRLPRGTVIAYTGELGMGKTAFTRGLARGLGCRGRVTSPTFTIVNEYEGDIPLFHFDLYRLGSSDELFDIGSRAAACAPSSGASVRRTPSTAPPCASTSGAARSTTAGASSPSRG